VVVCPASLKLNWEREARKWLPHRTRAVLSGRGTAAPAADLVIVNYEIVAAHRDALLRTRPRALVLDESHYCKNPRAKRTQAVRRLATALPEGALQLALTGTPVMNRPEEIAPQLRILGRLDEFGSGAQLKRRFTGQGAEERLHWHLRRSCFVRRLKKDVLPQLPAKRRVVVPMALDNDTEYRLAEKDVVAWLREQPLDLSELNAKIAATLRPSAWRRSPRSSSSPPRQAERRRHVDPRLPRVRRAARRLRPPRGGAGGVLARFPGAGHLLGRDSARHRDETVARFQSGDGRAAAARLLDARRRAGHHADARVERRLPRARLDAGPARPGRGPLPPHRPARRR
jgi:hypothetical protein